MKKILISTLLSLALSFPAIAEDVILTFSPETCDCDETYNSASNSTVSWSSTINNHTWHFLNYWPASSERTAIACGPQDAYIETMTPIESPVSEITVTIDNIDRRDISSIILTGHPADAYDPIFTLSYDEIYDNTDITAGELTFRIEEPKENLTYRLAVKIFSHSYTTSVLQISKIVYKELVEQQTPTLAWSEESAVATIGDDKFEAPVLTYTPDEDALKSLIKYSSSNDDVAAIDVNGKLTLLTPGTTTITASIEESDAFASASASYELTVAADPNTLQLSFASVTMNPAEGYSQSIKATDYAGLMWSIKNFSNGDNDWDYIRCGGNDSDNVASITTDFPIENHLENIVVTVDNFKEGKIENITLYAYSEANSEYPVESITLPPSVGDIVFEVTPQPGLKYSIIVNSLEADPDGTLQISKITYNKAVDIEAAENATLLISDSDRADALFSECKGNVFESNGTWVILKFETPDDHTVWHRLVNGSEIKIPTLTAHSFMSRATDVTERHGFQQFTDNAFKHIDNGTFEFYTENTEGTRSAVRSVQFTGVTSLDDIVSDPDEPVEYYNLQGIRIDSPTEGGIYLMRRSRTTVKLIK